MLRHACIGHANGNGETNCGVLWWGGATGKMEGPLPFAFLPDIRATAVYPLPFCPIAGPLQFTLCHFAR